MVKANFLPLSPPYSDPSRFWRRPLLHLLQVSVWYLPGACSLLALSLPQFLKPSPVTDVRQLLLQLPWFNTSHIFPSPLVLESIVCHMASTITDPR